MVNFWNDDTSRNAITATGRKKLVISGLATEVCAAFPALSALRDGYEVYVVIDALCRLQSAYHSSNCPTTGGAGAIVTTWVAVLAELAANTQINGKYIGQLLSLHNGQYYAAMNNYLGVASNASEVKTGVGLVGQPPIPMPTI